MLISEGLVTLESDLVEVSIELPTRVDAELVGCISSDSYLHFHNITSFLGNFCVC